jgi:hypothetical protein
MDSKGLVVMTAVGVTPSTGMAPLAVEIGFHAAPVSDGHPGHTLTDSHNLDAQFVSGNPGIGKERHLPQVASEVGAADADLMDTDHCFAQSGIRGRFDVDHPE